jgi:hypothetical protein
MSRRGFLKHSITGAAVFGIAPHLVFPVSAPGAGKGTSPHPNVGGLRVAGLHDPGMTREVVPVCPWHHQEKLVIAHAVEENLDRMALALTDEARVQDAWKAIFLKPPGKSWSDVIVAIKTNNIARQHTRSAVMGKICRVLVEQMNIRANHIFIYDGTHGADLAEKTPFTGLPEGCRIVGKWGRINTAVPVPAPWKGGAQEANCLKNLAVGNIDILINIALCKGHRDTFGGFTMTMKNHLGTFDPKWAHKSGGTEYLLAINKTPQILGDLSVKSGEVLFPRQQLCVVDALWASEKGPSCDTSCQPNRLYMGTFSPVLDYQVATQFRKGIMGWAVNEEVAERFLTEFGVNKSELPNRGRIIDARTV